MTRFVFDRGYVHIVHDACPSMAVWDHPWPIHPGDVVGRNELLSAAKEYGIPGRVVYRLLRQKGWTE